MRSKIYLILAMVIVLICNIQLNGEMISLSASGDFFISSDKNYKEYYGKTGLFPSIKLTFNITKGIYLWGSYGYLSQTGETSGLKLKLKSTKSFLDFGGGIRLKVSKSFYFFIEGGGSLTSYGEDSFGSIKEGSGFGYSANVGVRVYVAKSVFILLSGGYCNAETTINNVDLQLGGIRSGGGLGISF